MASITASAENSLPSSKITFSTESLLTAISTTLPVIIFTPLFLDDEDVSSLIRTPEASMMASAVSAKPPVRAFLLEMQRKLARENNVIMDGRDIGTVVLPNAEVKIFLTASVETRAKRRFLELQEKGSTATFEEVLEDMKVRDYNDSHRDIAPLKPAEDSVTVDTSELNFQESVETLYNIIKEKM